MDQLVHTLTTIFFFGLTEVLGTLCFTVRRSSTRWIVFLLVIGVIYLQLYHTKLELSNPTAQYGIGCRLGGILCILFEPMFKGNEVMKESRWLGDKTPPPKDAPESSNGASADASKGDMLDIEKAPFSQRFFWGLSLYSNPRAIGWAHGTPSALPPRPSSWSTRKGFISWQIMHVLTAVILQELNTALMRRNPYFLGHSAPSNAPLMLKVAWLVHQAVGQGLSAATGTVINLSQNAIIWVALGLSDIASWRPLFGCISDAYTVRNLWGKTWHQLFRRPFGLIGNTLADLMHIPKRTKLRTYFILSTAFALSAALHSFGDFVLVRSWRKTTSWTFFLPQIFAIWFEDVVIKFGRKVGIRRTPFVTMLGYVWVIFWFVCVSGPMVGSLAAKDGYFDAIMKLSLMA